jgi:hypothetical protein
VIFREGPDPVQAVAKQAVIAPFKGMGDQGRAGGLLRFCGGSFFGLLRFWGGSLLGLFRFWGGSLLGLFGFCGGSLPGFYGRSRLGLRRGPRLVAGQAGFYRPSLVVSREWFNTSQAVTN